MTQLDQLVAAMHASRAIYKAQNEPSDAELSEVLGEIVADEKRKLDAHDDLVAAVTAFIKYDEDDQDDLTLLMFNYADALKKARAALAKAGFK